MNAVNKETVAKWAIHTLVVAGLVTIALGLHSNLTSAAGNASKGKALYASQCASCHGAQGKGNGPAAAALNPKPVDLTDKAVMGKLTDQQLFDVIKKGGVAIGKSAMMPPAGVGDSDVADLVAYVKGLSK